ncbi:hypothetical protein [Halopseudomonas sp.]|uniref:hypothetical protein n=1 Tax=Halopseudomonas sp. TaxID=2901191 RepID=UPI00300262EB
MSPLLIGALVAGGVLLLLSIGFISHGLERARIEKARSIAELTARLKVCRTINGQLPGQYMSPELKTLLIGLEISLLEKLTRLDRKDERAQQMLESARQELKKPEVNVGNPPVKMESEVQAKDARLMLENLHSLLKQAHRERMIDQLTLQQWSEQIRQYLLATSLEVFEVLARQGMRQGKPRVAKLQYERAIAYLHQQNDPTLANQILRFKDLLKQAAAATVRSEQATSADSSELSAGLQELEQTDEEWKKKAVYDD